ncbi:MAG: acyl-CoA dehydratase activase [Clostridiales bacterium]|nr:acyl-CoA dehydratase activase [Clostridiales bacterium]
MARDLKIGVDIGTVTIGVAVLEDARLAARFYRFHHGEVRKTLADIFKSLDFSEARLAATGRGARILDPERKINDVVAAVEGVKWAATRSFRHVLLAGGETISLIHLNEDGTYQGHEVNSDCASGTGVFLDQQAERLGLCIKRLSELACRYRGMPPSIATRCAVFAKTDLVHCQQKGYSQEAIAAGLCDGVALSLAETLIKEREIEGGLGMAGGVALNRRVVLALENILRRPVEVLSHAEIIPAIGAALLAEIPVDVRSLSFLEAFHIEKGLPLNPPLRLEKSDYPDFFGDSTQLDGDVELLLYEELSRGKTEPVYLGVDVGSTSTKLAVCGRDRVLLALYTYTRSAPVEAVQKLFRALALLQEQHGLKFHFLGVGTTGSGRELIGKLIHADLIINEISAHARAAVFLDPDVDTIIEIGGQDSKFIRVQRGAVVQAIMNYICAAGTGSFIEEQAKRLGVSLEEYARLALGRRGPVISDRCTVYMDRDLSRLLAEGWPKEELLASVLHSVRDNYLMGVVGQAKVGKKICFQGATARNKALVAAFEVLLQKPLRVSRYCHIAGGLGLCLLLKERMKGNSAFVGLDFARWPHAQRTEICTFCRNKCQITVVEAGGERTAWGFLCGRDYEDADYKERALPFASVARVYSRALPSLDKTRLAAVRREKRIGLPRALPLVEHVPLWEDFFARLGFKTVVSPQEKEALREGKKLARAEFCAPILLAHGHADWLQKKKVDFIFFPILLHGPKQCREERLNYFCYYTSYMPVVLLNSPLFKERKNLLSPVVNLQDEPERICGSLSQSLGPSLRLSEKDICRAFEKSWENFLRWKHSLERHGELVLAGLDGDSSFVVALLGRPYNLLDRTLNHEIPDLIQQYGYRVLTQDMLPLGSVAPRYTEDILKQVHWHYGKKIIQATELVLRHPRLFPVYLTNFRCSPDAFITSYFKELMERQEKPYLIIQLDELSSDAGYRTRIEVALESFRNWGRREPQKVKPTAYLRLRQDKTWIVPHLDDTATELARAALRRFGYEAVVSEESQESIIQGLKLVGGGECVPVAALVGGIVATVRKYRLDPGKTAAIIPTSVLSCNFPQIPLAIQSGLKKAGLEDLKIFTTGVARQQLPIPLNFTLLKTYIMASLVHQMTAKTRPYEVHPGDAEEVKKKALAGLGRAIVEKRNLVAAFEDVVREFASIKVDRASDGERPLLAILGDLYVICNSTFNRGVEKAIEEAGGEALPASFVDISYFGLLNKIEKSLKERAFPALAQAKSLDAFVRYHDLRFRKLASPVLGGIHPLLERRHLQQIRGIGIPPELDGETAQNAIKIFYCLQHIRPDGFVHINPLLCCPGLVSSAIFRWVEEKFGIPVIHLFYDGVTSPNENLEPYIHYLKKKSRKLRGSPHRARIV